MELLMQINDYINGFVWGVPVLLLILGTGIFFTVRLGSLSSFVTLFGWLRKPL